MSCPSRVPDLSALRLGAVNIYQQWVRGSKTRVTALWKNYGPVFVLVSLLARFGLRQGVRLYVFLCLAHPTVVVTLVKRISVVGRSADSGEIPRRYVQYGVLLRIVPCRSRFVGTVQVS